jgi:hypothetical protein
MLQRRKLRTGVAAPGPPRTRREACGLACVRAAKLGQRKSGALIPTAATDTAGRCLISEDRNRRDYTLIPGARGRTNGVHFSSSGGSRPGPRSPRWKPRRCCSGLCWPLVRSRCARRTAGDASVNGHPVTRLASTHNRITSSCWRSRLPTQTATAPRKKLVPALQ